MASFKVYLAAVATLFTSSALAGFDPSSQANVAVYWGQNSAGQATSQARLGDYCDNDEIDIIPLGFLDGISPQILNFASATNQCTAVDGTQIYICPEIEEDIKACQAKGKTILLSVGGQTYSQGGFSDASAAQQAADQVWDLFGTNTDVANRPFGSAVVDGFDFDFESSTQNFAPFANQLRAHMDASGKTMYLSAAPQCVYPDAAMNDMLNGAVSFDFIMIQFYNNWCGVNNFQPSAAENPYNFGVWDTWAKQTSKNPNVKVLMGVPATAGAGGGYVAASQLDPIIQFNKQYSSFGGAMIWDMSQLYTNTGFLDTVYASLGGATAPSDPAPAPTTTTTTQAPSPTTTTTQAPSPTATGTVPQWGQCGGDGYTGPTECQSPYTCQGTEWWKSCQ